MRFLYHLFASRVHTLTPSATSYTGNMFHLRHFKILVEVVGVEPTMPEAADLQSAGVTNFPTHPYMVRLAGIEPARLAARDFKSLVSTNFTTVALLIANGASSKCNLHHLDTCRP